MIGGQGVPVSEWRPLEEVMKDLRERMMINDSGFILEHWEWKYATVRIDMRTGHAYAIPGNGPSDRLIQAQAVT